MRFVWAILFLLCVFPYAVIPLRDKHAAFQWEYYWLSPPGTKIAYLEIGQEVFSYGALVWGEEKAPQRVVLSKEGRYWWKKDTLFVMPVDSVLLFFPHCPQVKKRVFTAWLGTDALGRDVYSRLVLGLRTSLGIGLLAMVCAVGLGTLLGFLAGYYGGWIDNLIQWLMATLWSVPSVLLAMVLAFLLGKGTLNLVLTIALVTWIDGARIVRTQVQSLKERPFIEAAQSLGLPTRRILWKHLLPNLHEELRVVASATLGVAILLESGLSFLGLGVAPEVASWGQMLSQYYPYLFLPGYRHLALLPGGAIALVVLLSFFSARKKRF